MRKLSNRRIPLSAIRESEYHWKRKVTDADIDELADNMELIGQLHPIIVRPVGKAGRMYELLAGERRLRALVKIGEKTAECRVVKCDDADAEIISLSENLKTKKPTTQEWERGVVRLVKLLEGQYADEMAKMDQVKPDEDDPEFRGPGPQKSKPKRGRPSTPKSKAVNEAAKRTGSVASTVYKAVKRDENLISAAQLALERGKITKQQANKLTDMNAKKQASELTKMMKETRKATQDRLAREAAISDDEKTKVAKRMVGGLITVCEEAYTRADEALEYMSDESLDYDQILKLEVSQIRHCAQRLEELASFLES